MRKKHHIILYFLLIILITAQVYAEEKVYKATRTKDSKLAFVGGSACCNCVCDSEGRLPADFPSTDVHSVTFYLLASRSSSVYNRIKVGPTKLKLILGNSQSVAATAVRPSEVLDPVQHIWYVTFTFSPSVRVGPGTVWKLLDGDGTWKSAAIAHTSDKPSGGLPGKYITKGCQYARTEDHWYSVKFDFAAAEPVPSEGLRIVKKDPYDISVQLNGKEIYLSHAFDVRMVKSFKNIDGFNVDVLVENAGGNICQTYSCRIIRWRPDGQHKISDKFGNCQGPKISQEGSKIFLAFESYTMRHTGKTAPAETWVYQDGILSQTALPALHPRPILQSPQKDAVLPQGNNPQCPRGHIWDFSWTVPNPQNVKSYQLRITRPWSTKPVYETTVESTNMHYVSCEPIDDEDLERWRWQVRAFYSDEKWSEWSDGNDFNVALLDISPPSVPQLLAPENNATMPQLNNPNCNGFRWEFGWKEMVDMGSAVPQYKIRISRSGNIVKEETVAANTYIYESCQPVGDNTLSGWTWKVQAQDKAGNWSGWSDPRSFSVEPMAPPIPELVSPRNNAALLRGYNPKCGAGVEWNFDWKDVTHSNGIKQYEITIDILDKNQKKKLRLITKTVTNSEFTFNHCKPIDEKTFPTGAWTVRAQNNAGYWSKNAKASYFSIGTAPSTPIVHVPRESEVLPQQNNTSCKEGYEWDFEWEPSRHPLDIEAYHVIISHKSGTKLFDKHLQPDQNSLTYESCTPITDYTDGWVFQVRAISVDKNLSDWGRRGFTVASYVPPTPPSAPVLTAPAAGATPELPQQNNPNNLRGFVWTFTWQASTSEAAIKQYRIIVENPNVPEISLDATTTATTYSFASDKHITDSAKLTGWKVKTQAEDMDGDKSEWSEGQFKVAAYAPYVPATPVISSPKVQTDTLGYSESGDCGPPDRITGLDWTFEWTHPEVDKLKQYWIAVERTGEVPFIDLQVTLAGGPALSYTHKSCDIIADDRLNGWSWKVKVQGYDNIWSEWSSKGYFTVESYSPTRPVLKALESEPMPQGNGPADSEGFIWNFEWSPSTHLETALGKTMTYTYRIQREGEAAPLVEKDVTDTKCTVSSSNSLSDDRLDGWSIKVKAKVANVTSEWSEAKTFTVESLRPTVPIAKKPLKGDPALWQGLITGCDPGGYSWEFAWERSSHPNGIKQYELQVIKPDKIVLTTVTVPVPADDPTEIKYTLSDCGSFGDDKLTGWTWRIHAQNNRGKWSTWSGGEFELGNFAPSVPILLTPADKAVLDQINNATGDGYKWEFDWEDCTHSEGIMNYTFFITPPGGYPKTYTTSDSKITWEKKELVYDNKRLGWKWKVQARANNSITSESGWRTFDVKALPALTASASASKTSGDAPLTVNFTGTASGGTGTYTYSWNFGDGKSSSNQNPSHQYSTAGTYTAKLTVDDGNKKTEKTLTITATTPSLSANPAASPNAGKPPLSVNFTANVTGGTKPYTYNWDFGDGTSSVSQNPTYTYSDPGTYSVVFTVKDANNKQTSKTLTVTSRISESTVSTNPKLEWTKDNETFKIALEGTGKLTLMDYAVAQETIVVLAKASCSGCAIVFSRKKPNGTWVELERKTYTAQDLSQKKSISLSGPNHKYYHVHFKLCAWDRGGKTSYFGTVTDYHGWDSPGDLPSEFGGLFKILDVSGALITEKTPTFTSNPGDDLDKETEVCKEYTTEGLTKRPVFFALDLWENDHGAITSFDTGGAAVNDDDQIYYPTWAHRLMQCAGVSNAANCPSATQDCYMVERDTLPTGTSFSIIQLYMGNFSATNFTQSNKQRSYFLIDDKDLSTTPKANKNAPLERWYIFRHKDNQPDGYSYMTPANVTVDCAGWTAFYDKAYVKIRVWVTEGK